MQRKITLPSVRKRFEAVAGHPCWAAHGAFLIELNRDRSCVEAMHRRTNESVIDSLQD